MLTPSINVLLVTSQVCIHFAQHMAEAKFAFLHHLRQQYLVKIYCFLSCEVILYFIKNSIDQPVWVVIVFMKNFPEIL